MAKINQNTLAKDICTCEAGKVEVNVAQVKDVLKAALWLLANRYKMSEVVELVERHQC